MESERSSGRFQGGGNGRDLTVTAEPNTTGNDKTGTITLTLDADRSKTAKITLTAKKQGGGA